MDWEQAEIWIRAGGRCAICKKFLLDDRHGEVVPIGEVAHNVGRSRSKRSPRGQDPLPLDQRDKAANLLLLCRNEHRVADTRRLEDQRFTVDYLDRLKVEHEQAIHHLTSLVADRGTLVVRVVGNLGDKQGDISKQQVDTALAARDRYPAYLPDTHHSRVEIDLRDLPQDNETYWPAAAAMIDTAVTRLRAAVATGEHHHVSVFAMARIPLLAHLGARLRDTLPTDVYQRHRSNDSWRWPPDAPTTAFEFNALNNDQHASEAVVIVNVSGAIKPHELPAGVADLPTFELRPTTGPDRDAIASPASLNAYGTTLRQLLAALEDQQKGARTLHLFLAAPLSVAVETGRAIDPQIHPHIRVYDRTHEGSYRHVLDLPEADAGLRRIA